MKYNFLFGCCLILTLVMAQVSWAVRDVPLERRMLEKVAGWDLDSVKEDHRCDYSDRYKVYLIDNFGESIELIPEIETSHGEVMVRMLRSGRNDIDIEVINSGLTRGLALVLSYLLEGGCADAVISSVPGSNYLYSQLDSFLDVPQPIDSTNILEYRSQLRERFLEIGFNGFPSVDWLMALDANPAKVQNDARKIALIEAIGTFAVPVILPYGNVDTDHIGQLREVNVLSLADNGSTYSALDKNGEPLEDYPYSPLHTGGGRAIYQLEECPKPQSPYYALLDINEDKVFDYVFRRDDFLAYIDDEREQKFAPSVTNPDAFEVLMENIKKTHDCTISAGEVVTTEQLGQLREVCPMGGDDWRNYTYHWLRSGLEPKVLSFNATCRSRGTLHGTSLIPPNIVKQYLPEKKG